MVVAVMMVMMVMAVMMMICDLEVSRVKAKLDTLSLHLGHKVILKSTFASNSGAPADTTINLN